MRPGKTLVVRPNPYEGFFRTPYISDGQRFGRWTFGRGVVDGDDVGGCVVSETAEQMKVVEWCRVTDWRMGGGVGIGLIFHIPNGGWRSKAEAAKLKAMGVRKGVSDLFLPVPIHGEDGAMLKGGLWIELKAAGGVLSDEQGVWLGEMKKRGYEAVCAIGADQAIEAIRQYLKLEQEGGAD